MDGSADFQDWYDSLAPDFGNAPGLAPRRAHFERWCRRLYEIEGPVSLGRVGAALLVEMIRLSTGNAALVLRDIEHTTDLHPSIVVDDYETTVRVSYDGSHQTPSVLEWNNPDALAEVAGCLQEYVMEDMSTAWPICPQPSLGVHAEVRDAVALWWCRGGNHAIAPIGLLSWS